MSENDNIPNEELITNTILDGIKQLLPEAKFVFFAYTRDDGSTVLTGESPCLACFIDSVKEIKDESIPCRCHEAKELSEIERRKMN